MHPKHDSGWGKQLALFDPSPGSLAVNGEQRYSPVFTICLLLSDRPIIVQPTQPVNQPEWATRPTQNAPGLFPEECRPPADGPSRVNPRTTQTPGSGPGGDRTLIFRMHADCRRFSTSRLYLTRRDSALSWRLGGLAPSREIRELLRFGLVKNQRRSACICVHLRASASSPMPPIRFLGGSLNMTPYSAHQWVVAGFVVYSGGLQHLKICAGFHSLSPCRSLRITYAVTIHWRSAGWRSVPTTTARNFPPRSPQSPVQSPVSGQPLLQTAEYTTT